MRAVLAVSIGLLTLAVASQADAQIVNVQSVLAVEAKPGLSGSITGSIDWRTGNIELLRLSGAPVVRYRVGDHSFIGIVTGDFGRNADGRYIAKTFEHLRYRLKLSERVLFETFTQHTYDQFKRLKLRALVGLGPAVRIAKAGLLSVTAGAAYMPEYEEIRNDSEADGGDSYLHHRLSTYVTGALQPGTSVQLIQTVYFQPRVNELHDFRVLSDTQVVVQINKHLATTTALSVAYDARPPLTINELDTAVTSSLTLSF